MTEVRKARGRRPGGGDTKAIIQAAALKLFSGNGYDKVSLRAIAREADVDPALVHHYFDSKSDLFAQAVLDLPLDAERIVTEALAGPREVIGRSIITIYLDTWRHPGGARERFIAIVRAAVSDDDVAQRPLAEFMAKEVFGPIAERLGHENHKVRAHLAYTLLCGLALTRYVLNLPVLVKAEDDAIIEGLGRSMQQVLVEAW